LLWTTNKNKVASGHITMLQQEAMYTVSVLIERHA